MTNEQHEMGTEPTPEASSPTEAEAQTEEIPTAEEHEEQAEETFPRRYVEELRAEAAEYRVKAKRADELAAALWTAKVTATARLADPTDLAMPDGADPTDDAAVDAAVADLLARKPHLATRRPAGSIGQGPGTAAESVDLAAMLRGRA